MTPSSLTHFKNGVLFIRLFPNSIHKALRRVGTYKHFEQTAALIMIEDSRALQTSNLHTSGGVIWPEENAIYKKS